MGKPRRINDMMIYLNSKNYFNLKDVMERYRISKSFVADYFLSYTDNLISIKPKKLKKMLQDRIYVPGSHYDKL